MNTVEPDDIWRTRGDQPCTVDWARLLEITFLSVKLP